jgi:cell division septal protein FtsQ
MLVFLWYYFAMKTRPYKNVSPSTVLLMRQIIIGLMIAAFFGMLITSVWYVTRIDAMTITKVTVRGGETIPHNEVERVVVDKLSGAYLKIVPRAFAFTYPHEEILEAVNGVHRIKDVKVVRTGGTELLVEFDEYVPHALWCSQGQSQNCYFVDNQGYAFAQSPDLVGGSFLRLITVGREPGEHQQAFPAEEYTKLHELTVKLAEAKWFVSKAEIDAAGDGFLTIVDGGEFKVSLKHNPQETVGNLLTVLGSEKFAHIKPGNFEYIDLRFGSKVFVNEVTLESPSTSTPAVASSTDPAPDSEIATTPADDVVASEDVATTTEE